MALASASNGFGVGALSIADITKEAENFQYDPEIALKYWFRSADAVHKQAVSYERDNAPESAYLLYMRHALLASEKLPKHPEFKLAESTIARKKLNQALLRDLESMETLRPKVVERHDKFTKAMARRKDERDKWQQDQASHASLERDMGRVSLQGQRERRELNPAKNESHALALSLGNKDLRRRRRTQADTELESTDLTSQIQAVARRSEQANQERVGSRTDHDRSTTRQQAYNYPSVPSKKAYGADLSAPARPPKEYFMDSKPRPPPKDSFSSIVPSPAHSKALSLPSKIYGSDEFSPPSRESTATPDPSTKDYSFLATAETEAGQPLRTLFINPGLRIEFLQIAQANTTRNLETCGILCGTLISNAFFISKLVIPEQESTSDTCDTINESALFDYVDSHNLMTLGWIHTHPSQTCFMSSRDLHTHSGYQVQMAESIAIVCAPKHEPSYGVFRLTDPPGLKAILNCNQSGLFHPHNEGLIYTDAMRPGHVQELAGLGFEVVDLRPK